MKKLFAFSAVLLAIYFHFSSCNNTNSQTNSQNSLPPTPPVNGTIDELYMSASKFILLSKWTNIYFVLTIKTSGKLTFNCWSTSDKNFKPNPEFELENGAPVITSIKKDTYFGNMQLDSSEVEKIKGKISDYHANWVIFDPLVTKDNGVQDSIFVSVDEPSAGKKVQSYSSTGVAANPSPPKNY